MYLLDVIGYIDGEYRIREYDNKSLVAVYRFTDLYGGYNIVGALEFVSLWQHNRDLARQEYYKNYDNGYTWVGL